jgi:hypothetical protein
MQEDMDVFHEHGANAVLAKPLRIEIFESMVRTIGDILTLKFMHPLLEPSHFTLTRIVSPPGPLTP